MFHPLNLEQQHQYLTHDMQQLQRIKKVRPEDIDLPEEDINVSSMDPTSADYATYSAASDPYQNYSIYMAHMEEEKKEDEKSLKRKKFLSAQLQFSKKLNAPLKKKEEDDMEMSEEEDVAPKVEKKKVEKKKPKKELKKPKMPKIRKQVRRRIR